MLLSLLLLSAAPIADSPAYQEAVRLYEAVELDGAAERFRALLDQASTTADRATLYAWIGLIHVQLGEREQAHAAFTEAVRLDAKVRLPAPSSPDVEAALEEIRAAVATPPPPDEAAPMSPPVAAVPGHQPPAAAGPPMAGMVLAGAGAVLLAAGGLTFGVGVDTALNQAPAAEYNDVARGLVEVAYTEYAVAGVLAAAGVLGLVGGSLLLFE